MAQSDYRSTADSIYITNSEIELTEYLIESDGNGLVQDSVPEVDCAPLLSQSAGSYISNPAGYVVRNSFFLVLSLMPKDAVTSPRSLWVQVRYPKYQIRKAGRG